MNLFKIKIVVYGFLTPYTKCGLQHRGKPLRVDVVVALLTGSKATFLDTTECRTGVSKLVKFTAEITNRVKIKIVVDGFLAPYTKRRPRHRSKPLGVDVFIALLARPEVAFLDTTERRTGVSKLVKLTVEVTNCECAF